MRPLLPVPLLQAHAGRLADALNTSADRIGELIGHILGPVAVGIVDRGPSSGVRRAQHRRSDRRGSGLLVTS